MLLNNVQAAEAFRKNGIACQPWEVLPVKLDIFQEKWLKIACWKLDGHNKAHFVRISDGELVTRPPKGCCEAIVPGEKILLKDGIVIHLAVFSIKSPQEIKFEIV